MINRGDNATGSHQGPDRAAHSTARHYRRCLVAGLAAATLTALPAIAAAQSVEDTVESLQQQVKSLTSNAQLERGRKIYFQACAACHGIRGDGRGPAAQGFDPAPRNFRRGVYKFRTTISGLLPQDSDLERTVREGVPGTEMPRWQGVLSDNDIRAVVQYVKRFSPLFEDPYSQLLPEDIIEIPASRPFPASPSTVAAGRQIYLAQDCIACHGDGGKGDGAQADSLVDDWNVPIRPANLTRPYFKNGKSDRDVYRVFTSSLNGTPMPAFEDLGDEERWQLVDYVKSLEVEQGIFYWLFRENPNQVRHPKVEP